MGTTNALLLNERVHRAVGDWLRVQTTTNIAASTVVASNTLSQYDGGRDGYFQDWWVYVETMANAGTVRRIKNYYTANTTALVYGTNFTANTNNAEVWFNRYSYTDVLDGINDAIRETFPTLHRDVVNAKITTTYDYFEYALPGDFDGAIVTQVHVSANNTAVNAELFWSPIYDWRIDQENKLVFQGNLPDAVNIRVTAIAPMNTLTSATDTIPTSEERHVALLTAYSKYKFYDKYSNGVSSQDKERWEREAAKAYAEYKRLLPTGRMSYPRVQMKI